MQKKTIWITSGAIAAALVLGGVSVAVANSSDEHDRSDSALTGGQSSGTATDGTQRFTDDDHRDDLSGADLERASAAALLEAGGGTVTDAERSGSSNYAYEVDVRLDDGTGVDVHLDGNFAAVKGAANDGSTGNDHTGSDDHTGTDSHSGTDGRSSSDDRTGSDDHSGSDDD